MKNTSGGGLKRDLDDEELEPQSRRSNDGISNYARFLSGDSSGRDSTQQRGRSADADSDSRGETSSSAKRSGRLREAQKNQAEASVASASGSASASSSSGGAGGGNRDRWVELLAQRIRNYFSETDPSDVNIDEEQARHLLEASSFNLDLAAGFYWDEYLASTAAPEFREKSDASSSSRTRNKSLSAKRVRSSVGSVRKSVGKLGNRAGTGNGNGNDHSGRRVRRRTERAFEDIEGAARADAVDNNANHHSAEGDDHQGQIQQQNDAPEAFPAPDDNVPNNPAETVSVSDDEGAGGLCRIASKKRRSVEDDDDHFRRSGRLRRHVSDRIETNRKDTVGNELTLASNRGGLDEETLSDSDWLIADGVSSSHLPSGILWGLRRAVDNNEDGTNVVDDDEEESQQPQLQPSIPRTWLHAGFTMSKCGTGPILKAPTEEDVAFFRWRQQQAEGGSNQRSVILPPHHCKSVTAVLSVVMAVMMSGASIQGNEVNCLSARKPFASLSENERTREFESRLADALTALLFIALKASTERKKRILEKTKILEQFDQSVSDKQQHQRITRRLQLCPTCRRKDDTTTSESRLPDGCDPRHIRFTTSFTSVTDLRPYVLSNMRAFRTKGGCALFLETIVKIHGDKMIERMVKKARRLCDTPGHMCPPLINCSCEERQKNMQPPTASSSSNGNVLDTTPPGHSCLGVELVSLLLTGQVHSSLRGWSNVLGVGILSNKRGVVGKALSKPEKPVWIVRGETCYSVMWLDKPEDFVQPTLDLDKPGIAFDMTHWNCWYGQRNKSKIRVATARGLWTAPTMQKTSGATAKKKRTVMESIIKRRKQEVASNVVTSDDDEDSHAAEITEEVQDVRVHPEDEHFYPNQFKRWRYDLSNSSVRDVSSTTIGHHQWQPFHLLNKRQQLTVETKLAPRINQVVWTRWPDARIAHFTSSNDEPPVV